MTEIGVGSTIYAYNDALRKVTITNPYSEVTQLTRDTSQRLSRKDFGNGTYETFGYDSRNRPNSILLKNSGGSTLSSQSYTYDNASNVTNHTQDGVSTTYGYDNIDQLTSETRTGYSASYTYDANGNRTSRTVNGLVETYSNDPGDKLTSVTWNGGYKNYGYDAAGRMTTVTTPSGTSWLTYDYEDRLTLVQIPSGGTNTFTYNGLDTRVGRVDRYLQPWTYKRDGAGVTAPLLSDGNSNFTPGAPVRSSGTSTYQHAGIKNDTRQTDSTQAVSGAKQFDAFGNLTSSSGSWAGPFSYGGPFGYLEDGDSGLKLLGHRYYDSSIGRFITRDPSADGRNWYSYCGNNPLNQMDDGGLKRKLVIIKGDVSGKLGSVALFWYLFYRAIVREYGHSYDITTLNAPTTNEAIDAIADADAVVFYGHGAPGMAILRGGEKAGKKGGKKSGPGCETFQAIDVQAVARKRKAKGKGRLDFAYIACCSTCGEDAWVSAWRDNAWAVIGYEGATYDIGNPLTIPTPRLYPPRLPGRLPGGLAR